MTRRLAGMGNRPRHPGPGVTEAAPAAAYPWEAL
jgi:hypothetical protein